MRIEELKYFTVTAECKSMTMASEILHITQQCISRDMKNLEKELGVQLFVRSKRGTELTKEGQLVYERAKKILKQVYELSNLFELKKEDALTLGYFSAFSAAINAVLNIVENLEISLTISPIFFSTEKLEEEVSDQNLDIALRQIEKCDLEKAMKNSEYYHVVLLEEPVEILMNVDCVDRGADKFYLHTLKHYPVLFYSSATNETPLFQRIADRYGPIQIAYKGNDEVTSWKYFKEVDAVLLCTQSMIKSKRYPMGQVNNVKAKVLKLDEEILVDTVLSVKKDLLGWNSVIRLIEVFKDYFRGL